MMNTKCALCKKRTSNRVLAICGHTYTLCPKCSSDKEAEEQPCIMCYPPEQIQRKEQNDFHGFHS